MTKQALELLGRIFAAEVSGRLPYQSRSKKYEGLEVSGYCEKVTVIICGVQVTGWILTHRGRIAYCESC